MLTYLTSLPKEDKLTIELSELFEQYGYKKYSMAKFEEYSFYSDNRDFLTGDGIIAFNNSDGRLMALKPDITLSIVKNAKISDRGFTKLYYNENVYKISSTEHDLCESRQIGIELLGRVDDYSSAEIISLAAKSLSMIDSEYVLSLSHMSFVTAMLEKLGLSADMREEILHCVKSKNIHDMKSLCLSFGVDKDLTEKFAQLLSVTGKLEKAIPKLRALCVTDEMNAATDELCALDNALKGSKIYDRLFIDLSVINHNDYYNGIIFQGYVKNSPRATLSGGRYDKLIKKIRADIGAIGFAVYLDNLNLYYPTVLEYNTDVLIIYKSDRNSAKLLDLAAQFIADGKTVRLDTEIPEHHKAREVYVFDGEKLISPEVRDA